VNHPNEVGGKMDNILAKGYVQATYQNGETDTKDN